MSTCNAAEAQYHQAVGGPTVDGYGGEAARYLCDQSGQLPLTGFGGILGLLIIGAFLLVLGYILHRTSVKLDDAA